MILSGSVDPVYWVHRSDTQEIVPTDEDSGDEKTEKSLLGETQGNTRPTLPK